MPFPRFPDPEGAKCMGEFPMFPGWLFFEQRIGENYLLCAFGPHARTIRKQSPCREFALAECLRSILDPDYHGTPQPPLER